MIACRFLVAPILAASAAEAQTPLRAGDRIRVSPDTTGVVLEATADQIALVVKSQSPALRMRWSDVTRLEVSERRTRRDGALHASKWGLVAGVALGAISLATPRPEGETFSETQLALEAVVDATVTGAVIGAVWPGRRWRARDVEQTRRATMLLAEAPPATAPARREGDVDISGSSPLVEITYGARAPGSGYGQFPDLGIAMAFNVLRAPQRGAALVVEGDAALFRTAILGGPRVYLRDSPLYSARRAFTVYGQLLAGSFRAETSGLVHGTGGFVLRPGLGVQYGRGFWAGFVELDYDRVENGFVYDDRVTTGPVDKLSGVRVFVGATTRMIPR